MQTNKHLVVNEVSKSFGTKTVLHDISFESDQNEVIGLLGRNGAGKTTLLRILCGLVPADKGMVALDDRMVGTDPYRQSISYLSERNALYPHYRVGEYLAMIGAMYGIAGLKKRLHDIIDAVDLADLFDHRIGLLSKGLKQRVGLAAALIPDPDLIVLDEPVNGLDPAQILQFREVIRNIAGNKKIILSSHLMQEVRELCDRIILLDESSVKMDAPISTVLAQHGSRGLTVRFNRDDMDDLFSAQPWIKSFSKSGQGEFIIRSAGQHDIRERIFDLAVNNGCKILAMYEVSNPLDDLFDTQITTNA